ncbi:hypothetical protein GII30_02200 [Gordonia amarae]|nr:hypothetical protein [Gordonia amarae]MCS3877164.1 hypothetical protein [Gordonia amarae]QHN15951.1 hypothetical protein GII35_02200 [Gordonia amarae]QHN20519.1 hypothetical protein GII34_02200 [Gordonia amarae]QHN29371.1 hypothetical protein GII32_02205 [Gordonia amarae]QHN38150.1 hypothetical protein GII30_02200 [Gordonia amarae]
MSEVRDELHHLIDSLPEDQVEQVLSDVRRRAAPRDVPGANAFAWIGSGVANDDVTDLSTNPEHLEGFGRDSL